MVHYALSPKGFYFAAKAKFTFITVTHWDVNQFCLKNTKVVQLWHGTPMKKNNLNDMGEQYDFVIIACKDFLQKQSFYSNLNSKLILSGYPRNDFLINFKNKKNSSRAFSKVLCLPTHRYRKLNGISKRVKHFDLFDYNFNAKKFLSFLQSNKIHFTIKLHPMQKFNNNDVFLELKRSNFVTLLEDGPLTDINHYLLDCDLLVSDYSSVIFDFLLLNKPIVLIGFDLNEHLSFSYFRYNYKQIAPGPISTDWNDLILNIKKQLIDNSIYTSKIKMICEKFNYYNDSNSSFRIYSFLINKFLI